MEENFVEFFSEIKPKLLEEVQQNPLEFLKLRSLKFLYGQLS